MIRYTVAHNDDDPKDPNHRRVRIDVVDGMASGKAEGDGRFVICADGVPVEFAPLCKTESEAEAAIQALWGAPSWDLQKA